MCEYLRGIEFSPEMKCLQLFFPSIKHFNRENVKHIFCKKSWPLIDIVLSAQCRLYCLYSVETVHYCTLL